MTGAGAPPGDTAADSDAAAGTGVLARRSVVVGAGTALSRVTGFLRIAALGYALGATRVADAYTSANETPNILYELLLGGVLSATLIPVFVDHREHDDDDATSTVFGTALVAVAILAVLGALIAPLLATLYTLGVDGPEREPQRELMTTLMRFFMPQIACYGFVALASALLNSRRRFAAAAFAPVLNNVMVICVLLAVPRIADRALTLQSVRSDTTLVLLLGLGTTAGVAAMALALVPALIRSVGRLRPRVSFRSPAVRRVLRLSGWTIGYVAANQVAVWCVMVLAVSKRGGFLLYSTAYAFFQLPHGLFAVSIMTALAPEMAADGSRADLAALRARVSSGIRAIALVVVPAAAAYLALGRPLVRVLLVRGEFLPSDVPVAADTVAGFALGLLGFSVYLFALRGFYSLQDTRTPFLVNCFENALNVALAFTLFPFFGVPGLALSFAIAYLVSAAVALVVLRARIGPLGGRAIGSSVGRMVGAAVVAGLAGWALARAIGWDDTASALLAAAVGGSALLAVYTGGLAVLRVNELRGVWSLVRR